jgi:hypothetical protein
LSKWDDASASLDAVESLNDACTVIDWDYNFMIKFMFGFVFMGGYYSLIKMPKIQHR